MFAGYHSGRSAAGKGFLNSIAIGNHFMALKNCMGKTESVVMILLLRICFKNYKILDRPSCFHIGNETLSRRFSQTVLTGNGKYIRGCNQEFFLQK
jgi:hypothetical protein